ncbi:hypothetical protein Nepgr_020617 [Nepenthes gracilis]|uniref:Uncharacterized protein n=1 Tax=Nepenthes gracilis TaxID=150966 RepID=A0AAD3SXK9_NEPGR|nr:hypothetical protein Nepgr_020617 [Nepenthes gracilis]
MSEDYDPCEVQEKRWFSWGAVTASLVLLSRTVMVQSPRKKKKDEQHCNLQTFLKCWLSRSLPFVWIGNVMLKR